jgi:hypothetical protein
MKSINNYFEKGHNTQKLAIQDILGEFLNIFIPPFFRSKLIFKPDLASFY